MAEPDTINDSVYYEKNEWHFPGGLNLDGDIRIDNVPIGNRIWPRSGEYLNLNPSSLSTALIANGVMYSKPYDLATPTPIDQFIFDVTTAASVGGVVRMGFYLDNGFGNRPGALLADLGTISSEASGMKAHPVSGLILPAGRIWDAIVPQGAPATSTTFRTVITPAFKIPVPTMVTAGMNFIASSGNAGALPSVAPNYGVAGTVGIFTAVRCA